jgi:hypothetical protein
MKAKATFVLLATILVGCASASNVYEVSPDIFSVTATGDGYTTADRVLDLAMGKAQAKCAQSGRRLHLLSQNQSRTRMGIDTTISLTFRCL